MLSRIKLSHRNCGRRQVSCISIRGQRRFSGSGESSTVVDSEPKARVTVRLPTVDHITNDFPPLHSPTRRKLRLRRQATIRMLKIAADRLLEPPTIHLLGASALATLGIGALEGTILCHEWPIWESWEASKFVARYSVEQLLPSIVWETQQAELVARALNMDPAEVLRPLSGLDVTSANALLQSKLLATSRHIVAGFMMIAQLVRAAGVSIGAFAEYEERVRRGREPPLSMDHSVGLVTRMCGAHSHVTEVSMQRMGSHIFPIFEEPQKIQHLVWKHSENGRRPVYWNIPAHSYGDAYWYDNFPANEDCLIRGDSEGDSLLLLEADATNGNDPLALGDTALDLTIDDASQGFRRIQQRYVASGLVPGEDFRTIRVFLGNSMEIGRTGGGHSYTLRHRIRYAKEMDVLIDSRAPVLSRILEWCERVTSSNNGNSNERKIFFQTSSREYFLTLQRLLQRYGYEIYDPLDLRILKDVEHSELKDQQEKSLSLLNILMDDSTFVADIWVEQHLKDLVDSSKYDQQAKSEMLRRVAKMAKLPRLVYMATTSETVNAVEALVTAGEVKETSVAALIDQHEGQAALEYVLKGKSDLVQNKDEKNFWSHGDHDDDDGLQIICSSSIHDDIFRQVRLWAKMGFSAKEIQQEMNLQFKDIIQLSHEVEKEVDEEPCVKDEQQAMNEEAKVPPKVDEK